MANETQDFENMTAAEIIKRGFRKGVSETVKSHRFRRLVVLLLVFCIGFGIGVYQCLRYVRGNILPSSTHNPSVVAPTPTEKPFSLTVNHVDEILAPASDLITTKYSYTDADVYENYKELFNVRLPITTNKVVFTYSGTLGFGIDMSKLSSFLDNDSRIITIVLPELEIKYNEIDPESFEYYNVSTTIFNQLKMENSTDLIATLLEEKERQVLNDKRVMDESRSNTELILKSLLSSSDLTKDYKVIFK
jgi:hypothetical protein